MKHMCLIAAVAFSLPISTVEAATYKTLSGGATKIIAHRGASGYLPEHTLQGVELAIQLGADIVEPDVISTRDGELIVMHDTSLARTTNVEALFAQRNGGYNVSDFTLAEIKTLTVEPTGTASTTYPGFTPSMGSDFKVPTFGEFLDYVSGYNAANGTSIGVYPESKLPEAAGQNQKIVEQMEQYGFIGSDQISYLQSFSHRSASDLAQLQVKKGMDVPVAVLGGAALDGAGNFGVFEFSSETVSTLDDLAGFAGGVGLFYNFGAYSSVYPQAVDITAAYVEAAHGLGLEVHLWTFREADEDAAFDQLEEFFEIGVDAIFTDYTDVAFAARERFLAPVPVPASLTFLVLALGGCATLRRRRI